MFISSCVFYLFTLYIYIYNLVTYSHIFSYIVYSIQGLFVFDVSVFISKFTVVQKMFSMFIRVSEASSARSRERKGQLQIRKCELRKDAIR